jgi:hypothetical protein
VAAARSKIEHGQVLALTHAEVMRILHHVAVLCHARRQAGFHASMVLPLGGDADVERDAGLDSGNTQEKEDSTLARRKAGEGARRMMRGRNADFKAKHALVPFCWQA